MSVRDWPRGRIVATCAATYPLVWVGAGVVGYTAAVTSNVETGTRGLGHALVGFAAGVVVFSLLWAAFAFLSMAGTGGRRRAAIAALATPILVTTCAFSSITLAAAVAFLLPLAACWWAMRPPESDSKLHVSAMFLAA